MRVKTIVFGVLLCILCMSFASANEADAILYNTEMCEQFMTTEIVGINLSAFSPFPYETVNIYNFEGEALGHIMIIDNEIVKGNCSLSVAPTYNMFIKDPYVLADVMEDDFGLFVYYEKLRDRELVIKGTDFFKRLKVWIVHGIIRFIGWLGA